MSQSIKTCLLDGDVCVYAAGFGAERVIYSLLDGDEKLLLQSNNKKEIDQYAVDNNLSEWEIRRGLQEDPLEYALHKAKLIIQKVIDRNKPDNLKLFLTGKGNFREDVATIAKYKGNRDKARRPVHYHEIKEYLIKQWDAEIVDGEEADDALGIHQDSKSVICSVDKDLLQIPGNHFNLTTEKRAFISPDVAYYNFLKQCITGDSTDNILGIPGYGPKAAEGILKGLSEDVFFEGRFPLDEILGAYKKGLSTKKAAKHLRAGPESVQYKHWKTGQEIEVSYEDFMLEMCRLVYIRRQENELWNYC